MTSWLSAGVAETVTADLRSLGDFRVIDCRRVRDAVSRLGSSLDAVARDVHAGLVVVGSFQRQGPRIRITARLVNVVRNLGVCGVGQSSWGPALFAVLDSEVAALRFGDVLAQQLEAGEQWLISETSRSGAGLARWNEP